MHLRITLHRGKIISLALLCLAIVAGQAPLHAMEGPIKVVILGSSTAAGANADPLSESWANMFATALGVSNPGSQVTNLAVGGFTTCNVMPTGTVPFGVWNHPAFLPSPGHNITAALALDPDLILVNLPTNDSDVLIPVDMQIANYATIVALAAGHDVPVWITTSQPRSTIAAAQSLIRTMVDATNEAFAGRCIDFWSGLGDASGNILPEYNADGTHLNNAGHLLLFNRVMGTVTYDRPTGPFVAMHPRARTVTEGDTVSFDVISYGGETVTFQWQRNGVDIPGETAAHLFMTETSQADSGAMFRCVITRGTEQTISNEAPLTVHALPGSPSSFIVSDDFSTGILDTGVWTFRDPKQDATLSFTGTGSTDAWLTIELPGGTTHDLWMYANDAPQILQPFPNQSFAVEVKFASIPAQKYQMQGLVVQKDSANLVRFDVVRQGTRVHLFAATFTQGVPTIRQDSALGGTPPQYLRLQRSGDLWTGSFSYDGQIWKVATTFSYSTVTTAGGVFAGNAGDTPEATPPFTAQVDYFFNTVVPIDPEDGPRSPAILAPAPGAVGLGGDVTLHWNSTGNAQDSIIITADSLMSEPAAVAVTVASATPSLDLSGLLPGTTYFWRIRSSRDDVWSPWSAVAEFTTAPSAMVLRSTLTDSMAHFTPDTTWAGTVALHPGDWEYGPDQPIPVSMRMDDTFAFSSYTLTIHWDPAELFWKGIGATGSLSAGATSTTAIVDSNAGTAALSIAFPDTVRPAPGESLLGVLFGIQRPGRSFVTVDQIRFSAMFGSATFQAVAIAETLTTSVLLGDVASAGGVTVRADGQVDFDDLIAWSLGYWSTSADTGSTAGYYRRKFDFGPTVDGTPYSLPVPDGRINFEDLMIMASMYGTTGSTVVPKTGHRSEAVIGVRIGTGIQEGETTVTPVLLTGNAPDVHGLALRITGIGQGPVRVTPGPLLAAISPAPLVFVRTLGDDAEINIATIGGDSRSIMPGGELVTVRSRSGGSVTASLIDARDGQNQSLLTTSQNGGQGAAPVRHALEQNYPNPFNPATSIRFSVPDRQLTSLQVFDVLGRSVATLVHEVKDPGTYTLSWDATGLPSGMYLCRMVSGPFTATRRLMLVK